MDDRHNDEQRVRATLRGKGREILLGQRADSDDSQYEDRSPQETAASGRSLKNDSNPDASALALTPEEARALLNFDDDSPVYRPGFEFTKVEEPSMWAASHGAMSDTHSTEDNADADTLSWLSTSAREQEFPMSLQEDEPNTVVAVEDSPSEPPVASDELLSDREASVGEDESKVPDFVSEGQPIAERRGEVEEKFFHAPYEPHEDLEALTPTKPEKWSEDMLAREGREKVGPVFRRAHGPIAQTEFQPAVSDDDGGAYVVPTEVSTTEPAASITIGDPFPAVRRTASEELFKTTPPPDKEMLDQLVDDEHIRKLWKQIETLHEQLAEAVEGNPGVTEEYQRELLRASGLLLESRQNYDDTRAIVYRIRADLNRQRKVHADIVRYRPMLLGYYIGWGVALVVLFLLKQPLAELVEDLGVKVFAALYYPLLLGIAGALISGYLTLDRHTTKQRDFDPMHVTWYLFNPLLGGIMGLLMFLLASIANEDLLQEAASRGESAITYLLCVIAGMNQNNVLRRLNELMDRFGSGSKK